jgi:hypothetical protein
MRTVFGTTGQKKTHYMKTCAWCICMYVFMYVCKCMYVCMYIQGDQKVSVHLMITIQKVPSNVQCPPASLQTFIDTGLTLTLSVIPNSNYVIMVSDWNCLNYFCIFLYCNHQVHRDFWSLCMYIYVYINNKLYNVLCREALSDVLYEVFSWTYREIEAQAILLIEGNSLWTDYGKSASPDPARIRVTFRSHTNFIALHLRNKRIAVKAVSKNFIDTVNLLFIVYIYSLLAAAYQNS